MLEKLKHYVVRLSIFLIILALVTGTVGCGVIGTVQYRISISSATGGTVTDPGEGVFRYPVGTVVNLVAQPDRGYRFACWTTNAASIADVYDATTTITVNQNNCFIRAAFVE
jgi:hypothetical protein